MQGGKEMVVNKMRRGREKWGAELILYRPTRELLSPSHVHKPSKHKPAYSFLLNPEVILRPDPLSYNSGCFPVRISTKHRKAGGFEVPLNDSILHAFKATFYTNLPLFFTLPSKATNTATKHNKRGCHSARTNISSSQL